jgi:hypothetical protein
MALPTFLIGPGLAVGRWLRDRHQRRRKVKLTVHVAHKTDAIVGWASAHALTATGPSDVSVTEVGGERYYVNITNASKQQDIVVTHVWFETDPRVDLPDRQLPVRLQYSEPWETSIPVDKVPADPEDAVWLARCQLSPDDKVVKSKPRENVPPLGTVPRKRSG